jgi:hypothetical protein
MSDNIPYSEQTSGNLTSSLCTVPNALTSKRVGNR